MQTKRDVMKLKKTAIVMRQFVAYRASLGSLVVFRCRATGLEMAIGEILVELLMEFRPPSRGRNPWC